MRNGKEKKLKDDAPSAKGRVSITRSSVVCLLQCEPSNTCTITRSCSVPLNDSEV